MRFANPIGSRLQGIGSHTRTKGVPLLVITVAYTATGAITEIDPDTITFAANEFTVRKGITAFSFKDDGTDVSAAYNSETESWDFT